MARADKVRFRLRYRPCIVDGRRCMTWNPGDGTVGLRRYRWWSPLDWFRDAVDWWDVRRNF